MKTSTEWCWKCAKHTEQKAIELIYEEQTFAVTRHKCLTCNSFNVKIQEVCREKEKETPR